MQSLGQYLVSEGIPFFGTSPPAEMYDQVAFQASQSTNDFLSFENFRSHQYEAQESKDRFFCDGFTKICENEMNFLQQKNIFTIVYFDNEKAGHVGRSGRSSGFYALQRAWRSHLQREKGEQVTLTENTLESERNTSIDTWACRC